MLISKNILSLLPHLSENLFLCNVLTDARARSRAKREIVRAIVISIFNVTLRCLSNELEEFR